MVRFLHHHHFLNILDGCRPFVADFANFRQLSVVSGMHVGKKIVKELPFLMRSEF